MRLTLAHEFERRAAKAHDHEGNLVGYYLDADSWRELRARLAIVEALADKWAADIDGLPRADVCARAEALVDLFSRRAAFYARYGTADDIGMSAAYYVAARLVRERLAIGVAE